MKFLCGSCRTKYQISDEKVRGKILTIRCKKCGAKILVRESLIKEAEGGTAIAPVADESGLAPTTAARTGGSASIAAAYDAGMERPVASDDDMPTSIAPVPADAGLAGFEWYVAIEGQQHGPFAFAELVGKVARSEIHGRHYVWHDGMANWTRVREMADLAPHLPESHGPRSVPPPPPPGDESGGELVAFNKPNGALSGANAAGLDLHNEGATAVEAALDTEVQVPTGHPLPDADLELAGFVEASEDRSARASKSEVAVIDRVESEPSDGAEPPQLPSEPPTAEKPESSSAIATMGTVPEDVSLDRDVEDLFANVPRATAQDMVRRESTNFFVAAAGVQNEKKRNRAGLFVGLGIGVLVLSFVGLWISGVVDLSAGKAAQKKKSQDASALTGAEGEDDADYQDLYGKAKTGGTKGQPVRRTKRPSRVSQQGGDALAKLGEGDYIDDGPEAGDHSPRSTREQEGVGTPVTVRPGAGITVSELPGISPIRESDIDVPPPDEAVLSPTTIRNVVASRKSSVTACYQRSIKAKEKLKGKLVVSIVVRPTGRVTRASVVSPTFRGSVVGKCIVSSIRKWVFPSFTGNAQEIEVPFILQGG